MAILMTGGGTGGHLAVIASVKEYLKDEDLIYVGSINGQDKKWFENDKDFKFKYFLMTGGVVNKKGLKKIISLYNIAKSTLQAIYIIKKNRVEVIFSVGGYSSAPASFAAILTKTPLIIHEQNAISGLLNRVLKSRATAFISSYSKDSPIKSYPIKSIFFEKARLRNRVKTILFIGGSQGAVAINKLALSLAKQLNSMGINIIHQAGDRNIENVKQSYKDIGIDAEVFGFTKNIEEYMSKSDLAIARAGASTLWELSANGLPAIYIPYPYSSRNHQYHNALFLQENGMGWVMKEDEIDKDKILKIISSDISLQSKKLLKNIDKNGSLEIAKFIKNSIKSK